MARRDDLLAFMDGQPIQAPAGITGWRDLSEEYSQRVRVLKVAEAS